MLLFPISDKMSGRLEITMASMIIFVAFLLAAVKAKIPPEQLINSLELSEDNLQNAFDGLDIKGDEKITEEDLDIHFYHFEADFAKSKFIDWTNKDASKDIEKTEMDAFLKSRPVTNAVWECGYFYSESLREHCFADQILRFVHLVLDPASINKFFKAIEDPNDKDELITVEEVKKLVTYNPKFTEKEVLNFMKELGGGNNSITFQEFKMYVSQEDLIDEFRVCRTDLKDRVATYDNGCLIKKLLNHTMNELTELGVAATFVVFDADGYDIEMEDLQKVPDLSSEAAARFIALMDRSMITKRKKVTYGEFRSYVMTNSVKNRLSRECAAKLDDQEDKIKCFVGEIIKSVTDNHTPIWMRLPQLDMLFVFEDLDTSNDGKITVSEDLVGGKKWDQGVADKLISVMDKDADMDITLDEFNEFMDWPNIVYGIGDCLGSGRGQNRIDCYVGQLVTNIQVMLPKDQAHSFYKFYDKDNSGRITKKEVEAAGVTGEDVDNFIQEVGMGDELITKSEFVWYVRQQELSTLLIAKSAEQDWHVVLVDYMEKVMTEHDVQELFKRLDTNHNFELDCSEFGADSTTITPLLAKMYGNDHHKKVNFFQFWIYLNNPIGSARKKRLEEKCTKKQEEQKDEIQCYHDNIKDLN